MHPTNLKIIVRQVKNDYSSSLKKNRYWYKNDPIVTHFFNALQATFPEGEKFFIQAAIDAADQLTKKGILGNELKEDIDKFIHQEALHSQQHALWTNALIHYGYKKMGEYNTHMKKIVKWFRKHIPVVMRLAITAAAEHYTASIAFLFTHIKSKFLTESLLPFRNLLLYHAMEEIEHKSVCYDLYQCLSGNYFGRMFGFAFITLELTLSIYMRYRYLLKKDGIWNKNHRRKIRIYLFGRDGIIKGLLFRIKSFWNPSFHPWQTDERVMINKVFGKYQAELNIIPFAE
ncbi:MAG: metal-dependent hydrolase [Promethearchaeota archaeon]